MNKVTAVFSVSKQVGAGEGVAVSLRGVFVQLGCPRSDWKVVYRELRHVSVINLSCGMMNLNNVNCYMSCCFSRSMSCLANKRVNQNSNLLRL